MTWSWIGELVIGQGDSGGSAPADVRDGDYHGLVPAAAASRDQSYRDHWLKLELAVEPGFLDKCDGCLCLTHSCLGEPLGRQRLLCRRSGLVCCGLRQLATRFSLGARPFSLIDRSGYESSVLPQRNDGDES